MPKGKYTRKSKELVAVKSIVPAETFTKLTWWAKLNRDEQATVQTEGQQLATALMNYGYSRISVGEHLSKLRDILEPHKLFEKFLKNFHFSRRTAYRYIAGYENAKQRLPETVLKAAMARGFNIVGDTNVKPLGVYTQAAAALPPPKEADEKQANTYLDQLEAVRKSTRSEGSTSMGASFITPVPENPDVALKECYKFVSNRYKRLPTSGKVRANWVRTLVGMLMADLGVSSQTFQPVAVPEEFRVGRGRPREKAAVA